MSVSFVIPIWEKTSSMELMDSLKSLESEAALINEILIIFDGFNSFDLEFYASDIIKNKIKYVYLWTNKGPGNARNIGVVFATSDYIFLLDAGDKSTSWRVKTQLRFLSTYGVCYGQIKYSFQSKYYFSKTRNNFLAKLMLPFKNPYPNVTLAIKKEIFNKLGGFPILRTGEDWVFIAKIFRHLNHIPYPDVILVETAISEAKKNILTRRNGIIILKRLIKAHFLMFSMNLYNRMIFPIAILYQVALRIMPYKIFKFLYKIRLILFFKKS